MSASPQKMSAGGPGQGGQGGAGSEAGGQSNNGNQATATISAQQQQPTSQGRIITSSAPSAQTPSPISASTPLSSSSTTEKITIIAGVVGGIGTLLLIAILAFVLLNRRAKKPAVEKGGIAQPVTYANLNNVFAGVPFGHSPRSSQHDNLLPPQPILTPSTGRSSFHGVGFHGGEVHDVERDSGDYFLPTYAESQAGVSLAGARSLRSLNTSHTAEGSEGCSSPMSIRYSEYMPVTPTSAISPRTTFPDIPPILPLMPQYTRDTMGFPVDSSDIGLDRASIPGLPIVAPIPRHPIKYQDSLESIVREGMMNRTPEHQDMSLLGPRKGPAGRVLSQELMSESPVLGLMNPVRMQDVALPSNVGGVRRFESQRTMSSRSSMGLSVVSDGELERLGIGSRGWNPV